MDTDSEIVALQFDVTSEDPRITFTEAEINGGDVAHTVSSAFVDPTTVRYLIHDFDNPILSEGELISVTLGISPPANLSDLHLTISNSIFSDSDGNSSFARIVTPPLIEIRRPTVPRSFPLERTVNFNADAADPDGVLQHVEFIIDGSKFEEDNTYPFKAFWDSPSIGTYTVKMVATDDDGLSTETDEVPILIFSFGDLQNYEAFKTIYFSDNAGNPEISDPGSDPDGDGITNLLEYFLGLDPVEPDAHLGPLFYLTEEEEKRFLVLRFPKLTAPQDLNFLIQSSGEMKNWIEESEFVMDTEDHQDGTSTVEIKVPLTGENFSSQFLRLNVSDD